MPLLYLSKESDKIILETDAFNERWSAILKASIENFEGNTIERLCRYGSGTFQGAELNYHINEK